MTTRILITGGCGFIGANLVEFLLKNSYWKINILDNLSVGKLENIKKLKDFSHRCYFIKGDIRNIREVNNAIKDCDYVINLAAQTGVVQSIKKPTEDEDINIKGVINILQLSVKNKIKRVVQASSAAVLGEQKMPLNENKIPKPISPYGASKIAG